MREDWDRRAREDAFFFVASGHASSEEDFRVSGQRDLEDAILDGIELDSSASALEIGCGVGRLLVPLSEKVSRAFGVDISPVMIEKSAGFCQGRPNIETRVTDGTLAGFADGSLDFVFSFIVFQHIPDLGPIRRYVEEAARVLVPGGLFRFQVDGRWWRAGHETTGTYDGVKLSRPDVSALLDATGLESIDSWGEDTHYYWMTAKKPGAGARVRHVPREWDLPVLQAVLRNCGLQAPGEVARQVVDGTRSLRRALQPVDERFLREPDEAFVVGLHSALMGERPVQVVLESLLGLLSAGTEAREDLLDILMMGANFRELVTCTAGAVPWYQEESQRDAGRAAAEGLPLREVARRKRRGRFPPAAPAPPPPRRVADVLKRVGVVAPVEDVGAGESFPGEAAAAHALLQSGQELDDVAFVRLAYETILGRPPDSEGGAYWTAKLVRGELNRPGVLRELFWSNELRVS